MVGTRAALVGKPQAPVQALQAARQRWLRGAVLLIVASACAEAVLMPIGALVFQRVTLAGLALNLVAVPCMAVVQVASMVDRRPRCRRRRQRWRS